MKKTTYILIIGLAVILLFSLFMMPLFFTGGRGVNEYEYEYEEQAVIVLTKEDKVVEKPLSRFYKLGTMNYYNGDIKVDDYKTLNIEVQEADVESPVAKMDASWADNVDLKVKDGILKIDLTFDSLKKSVDKDGTKVENQVVIEEDDSNIMVLVVPRGMLSEINSSTIRLELSGFKDATLRIFNSRNVDFVNCSFNNLELN